MPHRSLPFRLLNVFAAATAPLSGNALCVFEDGSSLDDAQMLALARQMNLSETTFLLPSERASARVRIFTPIGEMPFAGHPTLGSAYVVRALRSTGDALALETRAGIIPLTARGNDWTLRANAPRARRFEETPADVARALGLLEADLAGEPVWIDTGVEQLIVPLASPEAVRDAALSLQLVRWAANDDGPHAYVWAYDGNGAVVARFFYVERGLVLEDPGTGSACANLGGWHVLAGAGERARELTIRQGERTGRACTLGLRVTETDEVFVTGHVVEIGKGEITL